ncbi:glycerol-3-phosphate dehydrogenase [Colwellia sp. RE-S-Sl-9]
MSDTFDIVVIGGGINGTGIAADAAGRGLNVLLCEQNDLASATSSNSSKLIHGGLRYLEHYEFRLVKEALAEREVLIKNAPHIIKPLTFRLPHQRHLRPSWMIRAGLFLYDNLAKRVTLPSSKGIKFLEDSVLIPSIKKGFEYSDGWVDDARLVVLNAVSAKENNATILTRTQCVHAIRDNDLWVVTLKDVLTGKETQVKTKAIVNASGPWVAKLFDDALPIKSPQNIRLVKGSHIVVPRIHDEKQAYMLQNSDQRIVFVIPFEDEFSLIGTTDIEHKGDPSAVRISDEEINYLINITNEYFNKKTSREDIVTTYSGVRPLLDDESDSAQAVTRDYTLELSDKDKHTPILSIFGGKITTYRKLSEAAVNKVSRYFPNIGPAWTKFKALPGGDFDNKSTLETELGNKYPWLSNSLIIRYVRSYGSYSHLLLNDAENEAALGECFGKDLYAKEVDYLIENEWALTVEDVIWRRTKRGLYLSAEEIESISKYMENHPSVIARSA